MEKKKNRMLKYTKLLILARITLYILTIIIQYNSLNKNHNLFLTKKNDLSEFSKDLLRPFLVYDSNYYVEISKYGYNSDNIHAFFPGYPFLLKKTDLILNFFLKKKINYFLSFFKIEIHDLQMLIISHIFLQFLLSLITIYFLEKIVLNIYKNPKMADLTIKFYIFNHCSIYYITCYSENSFMFFQTLGIYIISQNIKKNKFNFKSAFLSNLFFFFSGFFRSNGFLSSCYVIYFWVIYNHKWDFINSAKTFAYICFFLGMGILPFLTIIRYSKLYLCNNNHFYDYPFCNNKESIYVYIQKKYWGVYFLSFKNERNIFFILLLTPVIFIFFSLFKKNFLDNKKKNLKKFLNIFLLKKNKDYNDFNIPSYILLMALFILGFCLIHFNTITRFISAYPFFYIFIAEFYNKSSEIVRRFIRFWIFSYGIFISGAVVLVYYPL